MGFGSLAVLLGILTLPQVSPTLLQNPVFAWVFLAVLSMLTIAFIFLPLRAIVLLLLAAIPLDPNATIAFLPKLSALDYFTAAAGIALLLRQSPLQFIKKTWQAFPVASAVLWIFFFVYGVFAAVTLHGQLRGVARWGEFIFYYVLTTFALREDPDSAFSFVENIAKMLSVLALFISLLTIIQFSRAEGNALSADATFGQHNVMAAFLSLCLPACAVIIPNLSSRAVLLRKIASFSAFCAFVLSYSRGAWVGLTVGILLVVWGMRQTHKFRLEKLKDAMFVLLMLFGPLAAFLILRNPARPLFSVSGRPLYWQATWRIMHDHPFMGLGPGNFYERLPHYLDGFGLTLWNYERLHIEFWQHLHNLYFQVMVEYGLIGFALWAGALGTLLCKAFRTTFEKEELFHPFFMISILAYLTHNLVDMLAVNSLDLIFIMLLAITTHSFKNQKQNPF